MRHYITLELFHDILFKLQQSHCDCCSEGILLENTWYKNTWNFETFSGLTRKYLKYFSEVGTYLNLKFEFQAFPSLLENTQNLLRLILDHQSFGIFAKLKCRPMNMLRETSYFRSYKRIFLSNLNWIVLISQSLQTHHFCLF